MVAVVKEYEDHLSFQCRLIFTEMFSFKWLTLLSARETNNSPCNLLFLHLPFLVFPGVWKAHFPRVSGFHKLQSLLHDISSRCVMWEAVLILLLTYFYRSSQKRYYKRQQSRVVSQAQNHLSPWELAIFWGAHCGGTLCSFYADPAGLKNSRPCASGTGGYV